MHVSHSQMRASGTTESGVSMIVGLGVGTSFSMAACVVFAACWSTSGLISGAVSHLIDHTVWMIGT